MTASATGSGAPDDHRTEVAPGVRVQPDALRFAFARASGPGGQNVNKRSTKAELRVSLADLGLDERVRRRLKRLAGSRLIEDNPDDDHPDRGEILIVASEHRTQQRNKAACLDRLRALLIEAQAIPKKRIPTKPGRGAVQRRLDEKSRQSEKKQRRARSRDNRDD
ncbi:MAG: aminoacyl-tRNA hydrolase [Phycisphaeraceae bacterium]|nr:aminoacyl-tRNA hydrolase [Phycisphaeraceae bacterium]MCB9848094.1 aminoacyl-tRNA hydrolase [Phycisphaeraceae bacterium]